MTDFSDDNVRRQLHLDSMSKVGIFDRFNVCVFEDDPEQTPHVHIIDSDTMGMDFQCRVRLDRPEYIGHDRMSTETEAMFNEFMHQPSRNIHYQNHYDHAVNLWNDNNYDAYIGLRYDKDGNIIVPDYSNIS